MNVFQKTRELGDAILQSDEYRSMKEAEFIALKNDIATKQLTSYIEHKKSISNLMSMEMPDQNAIAEHAQIMNEIQQELSMIDEIIDMTNKRQAFADLIGQINDVLRFIITGETNNEAGCGGQCGECRVHSCNVH